MRFSTMAASATTFRFFFSCTRQVASLRRARHAPEIDRREITQKESGPGQAVSLLVLLLALSALPPDVSAQVDFTEHVISNAAVGPESVYAADVDGDGDTDVLWASFNEDKIAWYENDGNEGFTEQVISTSANSAQSVYATDVDADGDMDVLSASFNDDKIAWYENDGNESFTEYAISTNAVGAYSVYAADVDADGDMDVLSAFFSDDKIAWYENDGSEGFTAHTITTNANGARSVYAADVDGDNDLDVLSASAGDNTIAWYENDGSEGFTERIISTSAAGAESVYAVDVDSDGDADVLSASAGDNTIAWYENDGNGGFTEHVISTSAGGAWSVYAADVDLDGDTDVLSASFNDNESIAWYENDGSEGFTAHTITTNANGARSVYAADVDGDNDLDVLSASTLDQTIAWYEQEGSSPCPPGGVVFVDHEATGANDGTSWTDALADLQDASTIAGSCPAIEEVWVAEGTYTPDEGTGNRNSSFVLQSNLAYYGGFAGTETQRAERDWRAHRTILSGDIGTPGDSLDNSYHVVYAHNVDTTAVLDGFTVTFGTANGSDIQANGGGFYCDGASAGNFCNPTIENITFVENSADNQGGAIYNDGGDGGESSPSIRNSWFRLNAAFQGGAMYDSGP